MKMNQKIINYFIKVLGLLAIMVIGFYLYLGIMQTLSYGKIIASVSGIAINEKSKEQTGITETKQINLKLWGKYQIDVPKNYIKYQKQILHSELNEETLHLWALYPTFEGFTSVNSGIFNAGYKDNNMVEISIYTFSQLPDKYEQDRIKSHGLKGVTGILEVEKNFEPTPKELQPFSNPIEYYTRLKKGIYFYIYNSGDHVVYIDCYSSSVKQTYPSLRCSAKKMWGSSIGISYEFGIRNLREFGQIEKGIDKLISNFNLRKIKHD